MTADDPAEPRPVRVLSPWLRSCRDCRGEGEVKVRGQEVLCPWCAGSGERWG